MKVLFVYTNFNGYHTQTYSFGLASLVSIAKQEGHSTNVFILHSENDYDPFISLVKSWEPEVIVYTAVSSQFPVIVEISNKIKEINPDIVMVCGGVHTSLFPESLKEAPSLNGVFRGECEYSFIDFLKHVTEKQDYRGVDNFCYIEGDVLQCNPLKPLISNLDLLPYPDKTTYPYIDTLEKTKMAPFFFSRGCPFLCSYCCNHALANLYKLSRYTPRYRSVDSCIGEILETLEMFPFIDTIYIQDDIFGLDRAWREEFCSKYKMKVGIRFLCLLRVNIIDEKFIKMLKEAGCYRIYFAIESGNDYIRNVKMNRNLKKEQIIHAFRLVRKYGMETIAINIIGVPEETDEMIWETIRLNRLIKPTSSAVNIFYPYKGTVLGNWCFEQNLVDIHKYEHFSNERRDSVLKYSDEWNKKLHYYYKNWDILVYTWDFKLRGIRMIQRSRTAMMLVKKIRKIYHDFTQNWK